MSISKHFDNLPELTDDEALNLIAALRYKHNFAGIILTMADVEEFLNEYEFDRPTTDADVDNLMSSWAWNHMADVLCDHAWDAMLEEANGIITTK